MAAGSPKFRTARESEPWPFRQTARLSTSGRTTAIRPVGILRAGRCPWRADPRSASAIRTGRCPGSHRTGGTSLWFRSEADEAHEDETDGDERDKDEADQAGEAERRSRWMC